MVEVQSPCSHDIWYRLCSCNNVAYFTYIGLYPLINKLGESLSYMTVFIGLNGTKEELGIQAHNCWSFIRYSCLHKECGNISILSIDSE